MSHHAKALHLVFGVIGNGTGLFLFLSPSITFKRIITNRSTEQFSGIPYVMALLNCLLAAWYGLPFVSPNNYMVTAINGTGVVIESVYVLIFLVFAAKKEKGRTMALLFGILAIFSTVALVSVLAIKQENKRQLFCGLVASVFSIIMYASPLSIMIPNGFGCFLGAMQLILYCIYRKNNEDVKKATIDGSLEMGLANPQQAKNIQS
ncbi:bidirectional sugar transporter SWEET1-like isoform X2 [Salvia hispanica]|uniref:bidirectional sugar transporter SWEET1-like isoform X2 n=1 Tax=Salvia hispanica TaxID=49212 RepID=UPI0020091CA0|nr:bidirectional sugar transporter SWEET1-like isoform X2 [Salvia hispanica]